MGEVVVDQLFSRLSISWFVSEITIRCQSQRLSQIAPNFRRYAFSNVGGAGIKCVPKLYNDHQYYRGAYAGF